MKALLIVILLLSSVGISLCVGETLRISELSTRAGEDAERMTLKTGTGEEEHLLVKKAAVLTEKDIKSAWVVSEGQISVQLNDEGGKKLRAATERMRRGVDRLAIIVEGRLITAPIVHVPLDSSFIISGFRDLDLRKLIELAAKISGAPAAPSGDPNAPPSPSVPVIKRVPYTEAEYQANKAMREKAGIFYLEKVPSEPELDAVLRKGMSHADVIKIFGRSYVGPTQLTTDESYLMYEIAPEKRPGDSGPPNGFTVHFKDGKATQWGHSYSTMRREEKVVGREPGMLVMTLPEFDFSAENADLIGFFEGVKVPDPRQKVNKTDLEDVLSIAMQAAEVSLVNKDAKNKPVVNAHCDLMLTLAYHFPEIAALRESADQGNIRVEQLRDAVMPYLSGKPFPIEGSKGKPGDAGRGKPAKRNEAK
jgi:hypothetical protein